MSQASITSPSRLDVVAAARTWVDTPYEHQGRVRGVGVDCIGVPLCVARDLGLVSRSFDVTGYPPTPDGGLLITGARKHMRLLQVGPGGLKPGMVVCCAFGDLPQHFGIVTPYRYPGAQGWVHAHGAAHPPRVVETRLMFHKTLRFVEAYDLPGVSE